MVYVYALNIYVATWNIASFLQIRFGIIFLFAFTCICIACISRFMVIAYIFDHCFYFYLSNLDSVSGPVIAQKVRRRRSFHKRRSRDDLNASDSELNKAPFVAKQHHAKNKSSLKDAKANRLCVSAGEFLGKSREELILMLIQLRRTQSQLASTCEQVSDQNLGH